VPETPLHRLRWRVACEHLQLLASVCALIILLTLGTPASAQSVTYFDSNEAAVQGCQKEGAAMTYLPFSCPLGNLNSFRVCYQLVLPGTDPRTLQCGSNGLCFCGAAAPQVCRVPPLTPITDAVVAEHEWGKYRDDPDLEHVLPSTLAGLECMAQRVGAVGGVMNVTSAFRPQGYQDHLREVFDKWQLLKNDFSPVCASVRATVMREYMEHQLVRRPVQYSRHTSGRALDISGMPANQADSIAAQCKMFRPEPVNDWVHYEIPR
jgi:hypothetical protein